MGIFHFNRKWFSAFLPLLVSLPLSLCSMMREMMEIGGIRSGLGRDRSGKVSETEPVEGSKARSRRLGYRYGANRFKSHYIISGDSSRSLLKLAVYMYLQRASDVHVETDETTD